MLAVNYFDEREQRSAAEKYLRNAHTHHVDDLASLRSVEAEVDFLETANNKRITQGTMDGNEDLLDRHEDASSSSFNSSSSGRRDSSDSMSNFQQEPDLTPIKTQIQIYWDGPSSPSSKKSRDITNGRPQRTLPRKFLLRAFRKPKQHDDVVDEEHEPLIS